MTNQNNELCTRCAGSLSVLTTYLDNELVCFDCYCKYVPRDCKKRKCPDKTDSYWEWHLTTMKGYCRHPHCCSHHKGMKAYKGDCSEFVKNCYECKIEHPFNAKGITGRIYQRNATFTYIANDYWMCSTACLDTFRSRYEEQEGWNDARTLQLMPSILEYQINSTKEVHESK